MKCMECGADLYDGVKKCPYCKTPTEYGTEEKFKDFDFKYTISSPEQLKAIQDSVHEVARQKGPGSSKKESTNKNGVLPFKIKRIERKTEKAVEIPRRNEAIDSAEKARQMAKSASQRAAEFVPEGLARYTIRGIDSVDTKPQSTIEKVDGNSLDEYKRVAKAPEKKVSRRPERRRPERRRTTNRKKMSLNIDKNMLIMSGAVVAVLLVTILGISAIISGFSKNDDVVASYTYVKDNGLYMIYKGKTSQISQQVICDSYLRYAEDEETAVSPEKAAKNAGIVRESKDGKLTYFFENFDPETSSGTLKLVRSGKAKKVVEISQAVHNSLVLSKDGSEILYLQTTDKNGDMGVLYYWNKSLDEPFKIATDIDHGTFGFAGEEEWVVFIQNFNRVDMKGDLYVKSLKELKEEKVKIDTDVCKIYGTNPGQAAYIYAKDYDATDKSFDIYAINKKGRTIRLGERTNRDPFMQKTKNSIFVYGLAEDGGNNLYTVEINSGKKEKIASGVSSILMLSKDEKTVIYDKVYTGKLADYYAYNKGKQPQMIAHNVVVDYNAVAGKPQMAVDKETTKILYISEFESFKGGGTLNLCTYKKGKIVSEEQIAEDVYALYQAADGKFIVAKDYSTSRKIFDVYLLDGNELSLIKEEVSPEMFEVSKDGKYIYCITGFGVEGKYGNLEKINLKGESEAVVDGVFDFELTTEDDILIYKNLDTENGTFDLGLRKSGKRKIGDIDTAINEIIGY
ncbi:MAG: zinc ribbon domain-containing protein [Clostridia bacterium]|nr:zinc ribbon domain-containing protein [Clostridia bacterium]